MLEDNRQKRKWTLSGKVPRSEIEKLRRKHYKASVPLSVDKNKRKHQKHKVELEGTSVYPYLQKSQLQQRQDFNNQNYFQIIDGSNDATQLQLLDQAYVAVIGAENQINQTTITSGQGQGMGSGSPPNLMLISGNDQFSTAQRDEEENQERNPNFLDQPVQIKNQAFQGNTLLQSINQDLNLTPDKVSKLNPNLDQPFNDLKKSQNLKEQETIVGFDNQGAYKLTVNYEKGTIVREPGSQYAPATGQPSLLLRGSTHIANNFVNNPAGLALGTAGPTQNHHQLSSIISAGSIVSSDRNTASGGFNKGVLNNHGNYSPKSGSGSNPRRQFQQQLLFNKSKLASNDNGTECVSPTMRVQNGRKMKGSKQFEGIDEEEGGCSQDIMMTRHFEQSGQSGGRGQNSNQWQHQNQGTLKLSDFKSMLTSQRLTSERSKENSQNFKIESTLLSSPAGVTKFAANEETSPICSDSQQSPINKIINKIGDSVGDSSRNEVHGLNTLKVDSLTRNSYKTAENLKENNNFSNLSQQKVREIVDSDSRPSQQLQQTQLQNANAGVVDQVSVVLSKHINQQQLMNLKRESADMTCVTTNKHLEPMQNRFVLAGNNQPDLNFSEEQDLNSPKQLSISGRKAKNNYRPLQHISIKPQLIEVLPKRQTHILYKEMTRDSDASGQEMYPEIPIFTNSNPVLSSMGPQYAKNLELILEKMREKERHDKLQKREPERLNATTDINYEVQIDKIRQFDEQLKQQLMQKNSKSSIFGRPDLTESGHYSELETGGKIRRKLGPFQGGTASRKTGKDSNQSQRSKSNDQLHVDLAAVNCNLLDSNRDINTIGAVSPETKTNTNFKFTEGREICEQLQNRASETKNATSNQKGENGGAKNLTDAFKVTSTKILNIKLNLSESGRSSQLQSALRNARNQQKQIELKQSTVMRLISKKESDIVGYLNPQKQQNSDNSDIFRGKKSSFNSSKKNFSTLKQKQFKIAGEAMNLKQSPTRIHKLSKALQNTLTKSNNVTDEVTDKKVKSQNPSLSDLASLQQEQQAVQNLLPNQCEQTGEQNQKRDGQSEIEQIHQITKENTQAVNLNFSQLLNQADLIQGVASSREQFVDFDNLSSGCNLDKNAFFKTLQNPQQMQKRGKTKVYWPKTQEQEFNLTVTSGMIEKRNTRPKLFDQLDYPHNNDHDRRPSSLEKSVAEAEKLFMSSNGRNGMQWTLDMNSPEATLPNSTLNSNESLSQPRNVNSINQNTIGSLLGLKSLESNRASKAKKQLYKQGVKSQNLSLVRTLQRQRQQRSKMFSQGGFRMNSLESTSGPEILIQESFSQARPSVTQQGKRVRQIPVTSHEYVQQEPQRDDTIQDRDTQKGANNSQQYLRQMTKTNNTDRSVNQKKLQDFQQFGDNFVFEKQNFLFANSLNSGRTINSHQQAPQIVQNQQANSNQQQAARRHALQSEQASRRVRLVQSRANIPILMSTGQANEMLNSYSRAEFYQQKSRFEKYNNIRRKAGGYTRITTSSNGNGRGGHQQQTNAIENSRLSSRPVHKTVSQNNFAHQYDRQIETRARYRSGKVPEPAFKDPKHPLLHSQNRLLGPQQAAFILNKKGPVFDDVQKTVQLLNSTDETSRLIDKQIQKYKQQRKLNMHQTTDGELLEQIEMGKSNLVEQGKEKINFSTPQNGNPDGVIGSQYKTHMKGAEEVGQEFQTGTNSTLTIKEISHLKPVETNAILSIDSIVKSANEHSKALQQISVPIVESTTVKAPAGTSSGEQQIASDQDPQTSQVDIGRKLVQFKQTIKGVGVVGIRQSLQSMQQNTLQGDSYDKTFKKSSIGTQSDELIDLKTLQQNGGDGGSGSANLTSGGGRNQVYSKYRELRGDDNEEPNDNATNKNYSNTQRSSPASKFAINPHRMLPKENVASEKKLKNLTHSDQLVQKESRRNAKVYKSTNQGAITKEDQRAEQMIDDQTIDTQMQLIDMNVSGKPKNKFIFEKAQNSDKTNHGIKMEFTRLSNGGKYLQ